MIVNKKALPVTPEHIEQVHFFHFLNMLAIDNPDAGLAHASLNGARLSWAQAKKQKAAGMKSGIPDIFFPVPRYPYHGLYIEMKRVKGGVLSDEQKLMIPRLSEQGYLVAVCRGFEDAKVVFLKYFALPRWGRYI
jgi:hypothetical protein